MCVYVYVYVYVLCVHLLACALDEIMHEFQRVQMRFLREDMCRYEVHFGLTIMRSSSLIVLLLLSENVLG